MSDDEVCDRDDDEGGDGGVDGVMTKMTTEVMELEFLKSQVKIRTCALLFKSEKQVPGIRQNR